MFLSKSKVLEDTPFSEFIRKADSRKKKQVYSVVLRRASDRQRSVIAKASVKSPPIRSAPIKPPAIKSSRTKK